MVKYASAYGVALALFLILDGLWLGLIMRNFYVSRMQDIMLDRPSIPAAAIFYFVYVFGLVYFFQLTGALAEMDWKKAAMNGAIFGFFAYFTYNFTNLSVMRGYDATLAVVDTVWGSVLGGLVSGLTIVVLSFFL